MASSGTATCAAAIVHAALHWKGGVQSQIQIRICETPEGSLTMVIGRVGCGKSSLLAALVGEISYEITLDLSLHPILLQAQFVWVVVLHIAYSKVCAKIQANSCNIDLNPMQPDLQHHSLGV